MAPGCLLAGYVYAGKPLLSETQFLHLENTQVDLFWILSNFKLCAYESFFFSIMYLKIKLKL